jgi:hypothetical protein
MCASFTNRNAKQFGASTNAAPVLFAAFDSTISALETKIPGSRDVIPLIKDFGNPQWTKIAGHDAKYVSGQILHLIDKDTYLVYNSSTNEISKKKLPSHETTMRFQNPGSGRPCFSADGTRFCMVPQYWSSISSVVIRTYQVSNFDELKSGSLPPCPMQPFGVSKIFISAAHFLPSHHLFLQVHTDSITHCWIVDFKSSQIINGFETGAGSSMAYSLADKFYFINREQQTSIIKSYVWDIGSYQNGIKVTDLYDASLSEDRCITVVPAEKYRFIVTTIDFSKVSVELCDETGSLFDKIIINEDGILDINYGNVHIGPTGDLIFGDGNTILYIVEIYGKIMFLRTIPTSKPNHISALASITPDGNVIMTTSGETWIKSF